MTKHKALNSVLKQAEKSKSESEFSYFFSLLVAGEALTKTIVSGFIACVDDDADRNRYRLVRASGIGEWGASLDDAIAGPASQFLLPDIRSCQAEMIQACKTGEWRYDAIEKLRVTLLLLDIKCEDLPTKSDIRRWFRLFATLRNKTRGHGAKTAVTAAQSTLLRDSISLIAENCSILSQPWAHLYRNMSGKYNVSAISEIGDSFSAAKKKKHELSIPSLDTKR